MIQMKFRKLIWLASTLALATVLFLPAYAENEICATVTTDRLELNYTSFVDAWQKAVELGDSSEVTFTLKQNWKADDSGSLGSGTGFQNGGLSYSGAKNLTLDLNGCSIDRNLITPTSNGEVIYVSSVMTIVDSRSDEYTVSSLFKGGAIENGANSNRGGGIVLGDNATLNFNGGTILNCVSTDDGGAISAASSGAVINVDGGAFYGNRTYDASTECCGGAIYSSGATVNIKNAVFEGNYAEDDGGAICASGGKLTVSSSRFYSNSAKEEGGAVWLGSSVQTNISNSLFSQNSSTGDDGGAVYRDSSRGTYLNDGQMYYNYSASEGGAVHVNADKVFVMGGTYQYNTADEYGGGIYVDSLYDLNAAGKLIVQYNTVKGNESDLCLQNGAASTAYLYSGGFYEGSSVWLCSNNSSSRIAIKNIEQTQYKTYIHFDKGFELSKTTWNTSYDENDVRAVASAFSNGNILFICVSGVLIMLFLVFLTRAKIEKKKKGAKMYD